MIPGFSLPRLVLLCCLCLAAVGCSLLQPYQAELAEGNYITPSQLDRLQRGQTPEQVTLLLGTPLLTGEFNTHRWLYPLRVDDARYQFLSVDFDNGRVSNIQRPAIQ